MEDDEIQELTFSQCVQFIYPEVYFYFIFFKLCSALPLSVRRVTNTGLQAIIYKVAELEFLYLGQLTAQPCEALLRSELHMANG